MDKSCFFIGHRDVRDDVYPALRALIELSMSEFGITTFYVGHYGNFDSLAAQAVKEVKKSHAEVQLYLLLPYHPALQPINTPDGFDGTYYPSGMESVPRRAAIIRANRFMVDHVDFLIAYAWHPASNARDLVEYARKRELKGLIRVYNLADQLKGK